MSKELYTAIIATGSCIPEIVVKNEAFLNNQFYDAKDNKLIEKPNQEIVEKFQEITNIQERRWIREDQKASDIAALAAKDALESSGIDPMSLDFIIVGHNFGDISSDSPQTATIPNLASRVKQILNIVKPSMVAFDVMAGCPSWIQSLIVANAFIKAGIYKRGLVIGADVMSRISDPHDRDSMIFADGAGAVIVEGVESDTPVGIISFSERSDAVDWADILNLSPSLNLDYNQKEKFIRMQGHKVYVYALKYVPGVAKEAIDKAGLTLTDIKKVLIHQANEKMDEAICQRLMGLYNVKVSSSDIMPMTIKDLGNTSSATVPTLYDLVKKKKLEGHEINSGDNIVFTSVGAGMIINAIVYKEL